MFHEVCLEHAHYGGVPPGQPRVQLHHHLHPGHVHPPHPYRQGGLLTLLALEIIEEWKI